jgi:hypothetical protein
VNRTKTSAIFAFVIARVLRKIATAASKGTHAEEADGTAKNLLRHTISSALTGSKFDSVPSLLKSSTDFFNIDDRPKSSFHEKSQSMVSIMTSKRHGAKRDSNTTTVLDPNKPGSLSLRDVKFEFPEDKPISASTKDLEKECCFNCWSAGEGKSCTIHMKSPTDSIAGQNLSMCSNWDVGYLRRKYRAEEIQEVFSQQAQSLVFDKTSQQFSTYEEAKHPIYRLVQHHVSRLNFIYQGRQNVKLWIKSFVNKIKEGSFQNNRTAQSAQILCSRASENNMAQVHKLSTELSQQLPKAPVTGTTMREKLGQEKVLVERVINADGVERTCNYIIAGPLPVPQALYRPRKYNAPPSTKFILQETDQSKTHADLVGLDFSSLHQDGNNFTEYATFGRKGGPNESNLAVGGLPAEMLVSRHYTKCFPPQYKEITCCDDATLLPPKQTVPSTVKTLEVPPDLLSNIRRDLITPLDIRIPPTVMPKVGLSPDDRHYFGLNRVEQTGEELDFGFRTSTWFVLPKPNDRLDPRSFKPSESIATPNALAITPFRMEKVDESYPFCQENSRTNRVEDLYHLLLSNGDCSTNKLQVFTTLGSQQVGYFMQNSDPTLPIGRVVTKVIRTWAFLQREPEKGADPYNDPPEDRVYREEKKALGLGGVLFNDRPRYQDMPEGVLSAVSRADVRDAILRKSTKDESEIDVKLADDKLSRPLLQGLLDIVAATRVGERHVEYLPYESNLPTPECIEKFKPKTSKTDWTDRDYNPWTEGKDLISTHFVWSLSQESKRWPKVNHNKKDPDESNTAKAFAALSSLVRHGKFRELEDTLNNPEWSLPIDYCDESGNTLLMVACQNGNRRIVKLCLRRGSKINKQNLNGNTCLFFAFAYGFGK